MIHPSLVETVWNVSMRTAIVSAAACIASLFGLLVAGGFNGEVETGSVLQAVHPLLATFSVLGFFGFGAIFLAGFVVAGVALRLKVTVVDQDGRKFG